MKSALLIALFACLFVAPALAQDRIELYADREMASCAIVEPISPPIVQVHVFINGPVGATGVRFSAARPACWVGATWLGDALVPGAVQVSNSQYDWSIAFGSCTIPNEPSYLGEISYQITNQALPCCVVSARPTDSGGYFIFTDCSFAELALEPSKTIVVNPNESCGCQNGIKLAVESTSWGRVKALYR